MLAKYVHKLDISEDTLDQLKSLKLPQESYDTLIRRLLGLPRMPRNCAGVEFPFYKMNPGGEMFWPFENGRDAERRNIYNAIAYARRKTGGVFDAKPDPTNRGIWVRRLR